MASLSGQPVVQSPEPEQSVPADNLRQNSDGNTMSPRATKAVSIAEPDSISPLMTGKHKELDQSDSLDLDRSTRQFRASVSGKRLSGRASVERLGTVKSPSITGSASFSSLLGEESDISNTPPQHRHSHESLVHQVSAWLKHEKERRAARRAKRKADAHKQPQDAAENGDEVTTDAGQPTPSRRRRSSASSEGSTALEHLANILERSLTNKSTDSLSQRRMSHGRKLSSIMKRHSTVSSDTDYFESLDQVVPSCEAVLDNSKTLSYGGGGPDDEQEGLYLTKSGKGREKDAWYTFKYEIVRLAHTLRLKGWRRVPLDRCKDIDVERLSGALTNAVYVVSPPKDLPAQGESESAVPTPRNPPPKLLLRIYGPQVEHLIDREAELKILKRLARKRIGPRLLGTFTNGRFEEFFHAVTLTANDLRIPDTSKQIAKRMRELHEGIDLLQRERDAGPFVWQNWDKWVDRCEQIVTWLDEQVVQDQHAKSRSPETWKRRGFVCGVKWPQFRAMVEKYRCWLEEQYGGIQRVNQRLVFAHNDTQYGNILRLVPAGESPLLLPANEHKRLVVIDFEYANANLPGLEFANHFTEWCYNYHDPELSWACNTRAYPTPEEQHRFIRSYLQHNPTFKAPGGSSSNPPTPYLGPLPSSASTTALAATATPSSISTFMLDARAPPGERVSYQEQEAKAEQDIEEETKRLMAETKLWRLANSTQWVAWGIVQANVPGMPSIDGKAQEGSEVKSASAAQLESATTELRAEAEVEKKKSEISPSDQVDTTEEEPQEEEEEFDYLAYAQDRAFFWLGDAIQLGIVKKEELSEDLLAQIKFVEH